MLNVSSNFLNGSAIELLHYSQAPALKIVCGGDLLRELISCILKPPIFWNFFVSSFGDGTLQESAIQSFTWLLVELTSLPAEKSLEYHDLAQDLTTREILLSSLHFEIWTLGQKIG